MQTSERASVYIALFEYLLRCIIRHAPIRESAPKNAKRRALETPNDAHQTAYFISVCFAFSQVPRFFARVTRFMQLNFKRSLVLFIPRVYINIKKRSIIRRDDADDVNAPARQKGRASSGETDK